MSNDPAEDPAERLQAAIERAAELLPLQGPIHTFIHHNTLHALQGLPFHDAIAEASARLDTFGYLPEETYRDCHGSGRITATDLEASYRRWLQERGADAATPESVVLADGQRLHRADVHLALLRGGAGATDDADEGPVDLLGDDEADLRRVAGRARFRSHRDLLVVCTGQDPALLVNSLLIRLAAAYLDQGTAPWPLPGREQGFFAAFVQLMQLRGVPKPRWAQGLRARVEAARETSPADVVFQTFEELGVEADDYDGYVERLLLELPGWAGMFWRLERNADERGGVPVRPSLLEYLAVRACLVPFALRAVAREELGFDGELRRLRPLLEGLARRRVELNAGAREPAERLRRIARLVSSEGSRELGTTAVQATAPWRMDPEVQAVVLRWLDELPRAARQRIWQEAYERHYYEEVLGALREHARRRARLRSRRRERGPGASLEPSRGRPRFQVVFCIDDRSESIRRHLEECSPEVQTLGVAGFFGFAVEWRGLDDPRHARSCPVVVRPEHRVTEVPREPHEGRAARRRRRKATWARLAQRVHRGTRSLEAALWTPVLGGATAVTAFADVLFPRSSAAATAWLRRRLVPTPATDLAALHDGDTDGEARSLQDRSSPSPAAQAQPDQAQPDRAQPAQRRPVEGLPVDEAVARVATVLEDLGLVGQLAPLVVLLGHGSRSRNNPHASAYDCGACGGRQGGPNARIFALAANDPRVRAGLAERGILIPEGTVFLGGRHDTTTDAIEIYDLDLLPSSHRALYDELAPILEDARARNAHERCRRFESAPRKASPRAALRHVEARAHALDQPRPELGHATNALCVVGRRELTRGLFLDRRAFLVEYDPEADAAGAVLPRILAGAVPVCAGINLEYYFSRVDNDRFGCGTKLPHNVVAGVGVMDGAESDLRTGLPWQMVELHEPVRLLVVVEAPPERLLEAVRRHAGVRELVDNAWIHLCSVQENGAQAEPVHENGAQAEPTSHGAELRLAWFDPSRGGFVPWEPAEVSLPWVRRSADWYAGQRGFLAPASIAEGGLAAGASEDDDVAA